MNKFTLIVEGEENKPTPEQELETAWVEFNSNKPAETDPLTRDNAFRFYHEMRDKNFDHEIVFNFLAKKGVK
jgi:hypothetical protein